ncbi:prepilin peptidase [Rhodovibrio sodomensis]|uniref:prepilin peptidase n=1 Tax=Rhodovibrio sodomensis TaxID=1088 RepID=UPI001906898A
MLSIPVIALQSSALLYLLVCVREVIATDLRILQIPDREVGVLLILGLMMATVEPATGFVWTDYLIGCAALGGFYLALNLFAGRTAGIGFGDVKFGFACGMWIGWQGILAHLIITVLVSYALFLGYAIRRWRRGRRAPRVFPWGPGMALALTAIAILNLTGEPVVLTTPVEWFNLAR